MSRRRKSFEQLKTPIPLTAGERTARVKMPGAEQAHCVSAGQEPRLFADEAAEVILS